MLEEARYSKRIGYSVGVPCLPANKPKRSQELEERLSSFIVIIIWGFRPTYLLFFLLPLHPGARLRLLLFCFRAHRAWAQRGALNVRMCIGAQIKWCSRSESRRGEEGERERERAAAAGSTQRLRYTAKLSTYNLLFIRRQEGKRVFSPFLHFFTFAFALSLSLSLPPSLSRSSYHLLYSSSHYCYSSSPTKMLLCQLSTMWFHPFVHILHWRRRRKNSEYLFKFERKGLQRQNTH